MQIGIAGLPGSGKTTLFNALAHQHANVGGYAGAETNVAVVKGVRQESGAAVLAPLRTVDVLLQVIGAFQSERDAPADYEDFNLELQLADLGQIEKRLERL